ncbi:hypothetical protein TMatcc_003585 [Talaromyces marneffei ATCC 18224]|uniref:Uncharacterized protein n=2 Tax=Talaromyces marneffei TaxID=37727 RepID=B6Q3M2_TALMQ|nr:uncharacterized protein EYB26_001385 [Talaromyces marneffei]EEA28111.1 conserved hypothetical protein [Talaromyces marneffei ATCC 18224]KAE8556246.1 hypothetical protein EYB25_000946 [Talaromyces marneffei]QGA13734.1 hypothetical protein EYB26_001385 [Talaromyces marneffei]
MTLSTSHIKLIAAAALATAAVAVGSSGLYVYFLHCELARSTLHIYKSCNGKELVTASEKSGDDDDENDQIQPICTTIPGPVLTSDKYRVVYDRAWRIVNREKNDILPSEQDLNTTFPVGSTESWSYERKLLTAYLRRNMSAFARYLPQARIIKMMLRKSNPEAVQTLDPAFIEKLDFVVGDVVCGLYKVLRRKDAVVEFRVAQPQPATSGNGQDLKEKETEKEEGSSQEFEGRLVIGMRPVGDSLEVYSETIMWRDAERKGVVMPLERKIPRVLHELASWWLLDSGVNYLKGLKK